MTSLLLLDVDNTILEKQKLDNIVYEKVSNDVFERTISMLHNPVTREKDKDFAKYTNYEIWKYKIKQILESGEILKIGQQDVNNINQVDIDFLISELGKAAFQHLKKEGVDLVNILINPESLRYLTHYVSKIAVVSSGSRKIQESLLDKFGFYKEIDSNLCTFAEEGKDKGFLIHKTTGKYIGKFNKIPDNIIYVGDSENDMKAIKNLNDIFKNKFNYKGIGVMTGFSSETDLKDNGADIVVPNLKDKENLKKVKDYLKGLKNV